VKLSNAAICQGVSYGSEGEVSQILRWLAGELPTAGRWSHRYLDAPQRLRYLHRERRPDGGYTTIVLAVPEPIVLAEPVMDDPSEAPQDSASECAPEGSCSMIPSEESTGAASERAPGEPKKDHAINRDSNHPDQEEESAREREASIGQKLPIEQDPLYRHLMDIPRMDEPTARAIAEHPPGDIADFDRDVALAEALPNIETPIWFTVYKWAHGLRVPASTQEQPHGRQATAHTPQRSPGGRGGRRPDRGRRRADRPGADGGTAGASRTDPAVYEAILAGAQPIELADEELLL
jgi:hypothetical protein